MNELTEAEKGYMAGLLDADGCIGIYLSKDKKGKRRYHSLSVLVSQNDEAYLRYWQEKTGLGYISEQKGRLIEETGERRLWYLWQLSPNDSVTLLREVIDHLVLKRDQAKTALAFMELPSACWGNKGVPKGIMAKRTALYELIRELKHKPMLGDDKVDKAILDIVGGRQEPLWTD